MRVRPAESISSVDPHRPPRLPDHLSSVPILCSIEHNHHKEVPSREDRLGSTFIIVKVKLLYVYSSCEIQPPEGEQLICSFDANK